MAETTEGPKLIESTFDAPWERNSAPWLSVTHSDTLPPAGDLDLQFAVNVRAPAQVYDLRLRPASKPRL